jgi:site-specific recombinase XerC
VGQGGDGASGSQRDHAQDKLVADPQVPPEPAVLGEAGDGRADHDVGPVALRVIPARQLQALWRRSDIALQDKTFWRLAYDSTARAGELLGLDLAGLDLNAKTATVAGKGGIPRQINW